MPSWRDTLFIWKGAVAGVEGCVGTSDGGGVKWGGKWVGVDCADPTKLAPPSAGLFSDSPNTFDAELRGGLQLGGETVATADSSYMLDQGDGNGMTKHFDDVHRVRLCRNILGAASGAIAEQSSLFSDCPHTFVTACGSNEFGPFVSLGCFFAQELMLARRYLAAQDARAAWTVLDLEAAAAGSQFDPAAPWSHKLLHSRKMSRRDAQELLARAGAASPVEGGSGRRRKMQKTSGGTVDHSVITSTALVGVSEARLQRDAIGRLVVEDGLMRFGRVHH